MDENVPGSVFRIQITPDGVATVEEFNGTAFFRALAQCGFDIQIDKDGLAVHNLLKSDGHPTPGFSLRVRVGSGTEGTECPACSAVPELSPFLRKMADAHPAMKEALEAKLVAITPGEKCIGVSIEGIRNAERERCALIADRFTSGEDECGAGFGRSHPCCGCSVDIAARIRGGA